MVEDSEDKVTRREFLYPVTAGMGAAAVGLGGWTILRAAGPTRTVSPSLSVDLTAIPEGGEITVIFQREPFLIRHRTAQEIAAAESGDSAIVIDPLARNANLDPEAPATDRNRRATPDGRFAVYSKVCTHMGCVVIGNRAGAFGGSFCPCHGANYDAAGRIRTGPAPRNLPIPAFSIRDGTILELQPREWVTDLVIDRLIRGE